MPATSFRMQLVVQPSKHDPHRTQLNTMSFHVLWCCFWRWHKQKCWPVLNHCDMVGTHRGQVDIRFFSEAFVMCSQSSLNAMHSETCTGWFFSWDHRRHLHSVASKWKLCSSQGCLSLDGLVVLVATRTVQGLDAIS